MKKVIFLIVYFMFIMILSVNADISRENEKIINDYIDIYGEKLQDGIDKADYNNS